MVNIFLENKIILRCKNTVISFLYDEITKVINIEKITLTADLENLFERFDLAGYGIDFEIDQFIKDKKNLDIFLNILKKALNLYFEKFYSLDNETKKNWNFYNEILNYSNTKKAIK